MYERAPSLRIASAPSSASSTDSAVRPSHGAVIYRKLSFGRQSEIGEQRIARLLSAPTTCRLQRRSLHADLIDLLGAHARGDQRPCWPDARPASLNAYPSASNALRGPRK